LPPANPLRHRFTAAEDGLLGTVPDEEAAAKFGCSAESVKARRCRLGIPIFNSKIRH
jgi:hypothetical protein